MIDQVHCYFFMVLAILSLNMFIRYLIILAEYKIQILMYRAGNRLSPLSGKLKGRMIINMLFYCKLKSEHKIISTYFT